jgi:hypothetical protein
LGRGVDPLRVHLIGRHGHALELQDYRGLVGVAAAKLQNVMAVTEATGRCWHRTRREDDKSGVGFRKGNLRPDLVSRKIADVRVGREIALSSAIRQAARDG